MIASPRYRLRDSRIIAPPADLDLNFAQGAMPTGTNLVATRSTTGFRTNPLGYIEELNQNIPRIEYDPITGECLGLLVEEARTNKIPNNGDTSQPNWAVQNAIKTENAATSPTGNNTATKIAASAVSGMHGAYPTTVAAVANKRHTFSVFVKYGGVRYLSISCHDSSTVPGSETLQTFDLINGTFGNWYNTAPLRTKVKRYRDGWFRVSMTCQWTTSLISTGIFCIPDDRNPRTGNWLGNGTDGALWYGWDVQQGDGETSLIRTYGSAVTRAMDVVHYSDPSGRPWRNFNPQEGTVLAEFRSPYGPDLQAQAQRAILEITQNNDRSVGKVCIYNYEDARGTTCEVDTTAYSSIGRWSYPFVADQPYVLAFGWRKRNYAAKNKQAGMRIRADSGEVSPDATPTMTTANRMGIGQFGNSAADSVFNGTISRIRCWNRRLPNEVLERLAP